MFQHRPKKYPIGFQARGNYLFVEAKAFTRNYNSAFEEFIKTSTRAWACGVGS